MGNVKTLDKCPISVILISLNEEHNIDAVLDNICGWAEAIFLVDSFSSDKTVDIALARGVSVVQRSFRGFGDQWNFALQHLPLETPWTMKLDPDERLTEQLKMEIRRAISAGDADGLEVERRLWFMGRRLPVRQRLVRVWRNGKCRFSDVLVNEHPLVEGRVVSVTGELEHHDSPNLHHWFDKQNRYSTAEALSAFQGAALAEIPRLLGTGLQRRMWFKRVLRHFPMRWFLVLAYCLLVQGAWRAGRVGWIWASLRAHVYRMRALKLLEMRMKGQAMQLPAKAVGPPHPGARQAD